LFILARTYLLANIVFALSASGQVSSSTELVNTFAEACGLEQVPNMGSAEEINSDAWVPVKSLPPFIADLAPLPLGEIVEDGAPWLSKRSALSTLYLRKDSHFPTVDDSSS
jgi:hypothetical protein